MPVASKEFLLNVIKNKRMTAELEINQQELEKAAFILKSIAHPSRLAIIQILSKNGVKNPEKKIQISWIPLRT